MIWFGGFSPLVPFLVVGLVAILVRVVQSQRRDTRNSAVEAIAMSVDFEYSYLDGVGICDLPFGLFRLGQGRQAQRVIRGTHNGLPLSIFDYEYYVQGRSRDYHRFTCAILTVPAACPWLRIEHETALSRLEDHLSHDDVKLEYDEFNNRFHVECQNQKFAFSLLDAQMMEWLLGSNAFTSVEIVGPWVLVARALLDPAHWLDLGVWLDEFHTHIPPLVYSAFPPR